MQERSLPVDPYGPSVPKRIRRSEPGDAPPQGGTGCGGRTLDHGTGSHRRCGLNPPRQSNEEKCHVTRDDPCADPSNPALFVSGNVMTEYLESESNLKYEGRLSDFAF